MDALTFITSYWLIAFLLPGRKNLIENIIAQAAEHFVEKGGFCLLNGLIGRKFKTAAYIIFLGLIMDLVEIYFEVVYPM